MHHLRAVTESSAEDRKRRLEAQKQNKEMRSAKLERTRHGGAHDDVELVNVFRSLGIDFFSVPRDQLFGLIQKTWEGRRIDDIPESAIPFLSENFNVRRVYDGEGRALVHFENLEEENMKLHTQLAEISGQPRKIVKAVMEAFLKQVRRSLKADRGIRIPEFGKLSVRYRKAKPKRKGRNPFTGQTGWFKAKPASNKLRFSPAKDLKRFVAEKIEVIEPKKKKKGKKGKKSKKHHKK
jgi:nucleoid DNA-binding protein